MLKSGGMISINSRFFAYRDTRKEEVQSGVLGGGEGAMR